MKIASNEKEDYGVIESICNMFASLLPLLLQSESNIQPLRLADCADALTWAGGWAGGLFAGLFEIKANSASQ